MQPVTFEAKAQLFVALEQAAFSAPDAPQDFSLEAAQAGFSVELAHAGCSAAWAQAGCSDGVSSTAVSSCSAPDWYDTTRLSANTSIVITAIEQADFISRSFLFLGLLYETTRRPLYFTDDPISMRIGLRKVDAPVSHKRTVSMVQESIPDGPVNFKYYCQRYYVYAG